MVSQSGEGRGTPNARRLCDARSGEGLEAPSGSVLVWSLYIIIAFCPRTLRLLRQSGPGRFQLRLQQGRMMTGVLLTRAGLDRFVSSSDRVSVTSEGCRRKVNTLPLLSCCPWLVDRSCPKGASSDSSPGELPGDKPRSPPELFGDRPLSVHRPLWPVTGRPSRRHAFHSSRSLRKCPSSSTLPTCTSTTASGSLLLPLSTQTRPAHQLPSRRLQPLPLHLWLLHGFLTLVNHFDSLSSILM